MFRKKRTKRSIGTIFKTKSKATNSDKFRRKYLRKRYTNNFFKYLLLFLAISVLIFLAWSSVKYVVELRLSKANGDTITYEKGFVIGFDMIPEYPNSTFIFEKYLSEDHVREFLSSGNSVYRLPPYTEFSEVVNYYNTEMENNKWKHVLSVPLESEDMRYGEYWTKEGKGVRIYSRLNDLWYESLSIEAAKTGLAADVKKEVERELLLLSNESFDLRPDFPWRLKVPTEYLVSYTGSEIGELQSVEFKKIGSSKSVLIKPLGYLGAFSFDGFLDNYLAEYNKDSKQSWYVVNSIVKSVANQEAIYAVLTSGSSAGEAYIVSNPRNTVVYIIVAFEEGNPFLSYIAENISPTDSSY